MTKTKTYWTIEDIVSEMESALARMGVVIVASTDDIPGDEQLSATATLSSMDAIKGTASYLYRHMLYGTTSPTLDEMLNPPPVQVTAYVSPNPHDGKNRSLGISVFYSTTATTTEDT